ncbi:MAG: response regulator [Candidatus Omnitrophica bacterium]|nr:response regulator [Candidatus Omnitrophota bacterium]
MKGRKKILIVDDEESFCRLVKLNLEQTGEFEVRTETKGIRALPAAREFKPDFILLDIVMPDMDGGEIAHQLSEDAELKNIPVGFLTALIRDYEVTPQGDTIAGRPFIAKPVTVAQLINFIKNNMIQY